jgi:hypothetical protein
MPVDAAEVDELRQAAANAPESDRCGLAALHSIDEVLAYAADYARAEDWPEADTVETLVRAAELSPDSVRGSERILRALGYRSICTRLREITGRRKHALAPLAST